MRYLIIIFCILILSQESSFASELRFECPTEIQTNQTIKNKAPTGWTSLREAQSRHWLDSLSIFDGPPQDLASLVPDDEDNQEIKKTVWTFNKKKKRPIWMTCSYLKTDMLFAKALPMEITQCKLILSKNNPQSVIGINCK